MDIVVVVSVYIIFGFTPEQLSENSKLVFYGISEQFAPT